MLSSALKSKGMVITEVSPQERERIREKLKSVTEKYTKEVGEPLVKELYVELQKAQSRK